MALSAEKPWLYAFGPFRLDPIRGLLHFGVEAIPLPERLVKILVILIQANGSVVDKDTIATALRPDGDASDANVAQHMYMLRQLLGERVRDRSYIVTAHRRGYRLAAPVRVVSPEDFESSTDEREPAGEKLLLSGPDVFLHFRNGSYHLEKGTACALRTAIEQFEAALELDPNYIPALIGLAKANVTLAQCWYAPRSYTFPRAKTAILHALQLEPSSATAHAVLSSIMLYCDLDWSEAERESNTAIRLNPSSIAARVNAAWFHACAANATKALEEVEYALQLYPASPQLQILLGQIYVHAGDYYRAIRYLTDLIESGTEFEGARKYRVQALLLSGKPVDALGDLLIMPVDRAEDLAFRLPLLARAYADSGDAMRADGIYASLREMAQREYVVKWNLAAVAVSLGRQDEAIDYLDRAIEEHEPSVPLLRNSAWFEPIARDQRFKGLQQRVCH